MDIHVPYLLVYIVLEVEGIEPRHCKLNFSNGNVSLITEEGLCSINSEKVDGIKDLHHGEWYLVTFIVSYWLKVYLELES